MQRRTETPLAELEHELARKRARIAQLEQTFIVALPAGPASEAAPDAARLAPAARPEPDSSSVEPSRTAIREFEAM